MLKQKCSTSSKVRFSGEVNEKKWSCDVSADIIWEKLVISGLIMCENIRIERCLTYQKLNLNDTNLNPKGSSFIEAW